MAAVAHDCFLRNSRYSRERGSGLCSFARYCPHYATALSHLVVRWVRARSPTAAAAVTTTAATNSLGDCQNEPTNQRGKERKRKPHSAQSQDIFATGGRFAEGGSSLPRRILSRFQIIIIKGVENDLQCKRVERMI